LKLNYDTLLSNFAFEFNLRRYNVAFAVLLPLLASWLFGTALAMVAALWAMNHVAAVDARQKKYLERKVRAEELGKFQGRRGARQGGAA
jgi:hypothetical protein